MKSLTEAKKFLKENNVKYILAQFVDIHGVAKVKSVPAAHLEDVLTTGAGFAGGPFGEWALHQMARTIWQLVIYLLCH